MTDASRVRLIALWCALTPLGCSSDPRPSPMGRDLQPTAGTAGAAPWLPIGGSSAPPPFAGSPGFAGTTAPVTAGTTGAGAGGSAGDSSGSGGSAGDAAGAPAAGSMACEDDDAGVDDEDAGVTDCAVMGDLRVQYRAADTNPADNGVKPHFNVINDGEATVPLTDLSLRYWYTLEAGAPQQNFFCDYAQIDCANVRSAFVAEARTGATHYLELSFTSGTLAAHSRTGEIQIRFHYEGWGNLNESDDYSFDPSKTSFADWPRVTLYLRGVLVWGQEPPLP